MFKGSRSVAALGAVFFASVASHACGSSGIPSNAVVQVGGEPITNGDLQPLAGRGGFLQRADARRGRRRPSRSCRTRPPTARASRTCRRRRRSRRRASRRPTAAQLKTQCEQQYTALKQQVLGFLISANWVIGEATDQGIKVTDAEVEKKFKELKTQQFPKAADFQKFLTSTGQSVSDLLLRVKLNLLSQKIQQKIAKKGTPTTAQIEKYYKENKQRFGQPEKRDLELILTKTQAQAEAAKKEIESGKSFESVAKKYSIDPASKANGGKLPGVVKGQEQKALDAAIFAAKPNTLTGPVKTPFGYYIFEVTAVHPPSQQTLAQVKESIKQQLTAQQQQGALTKFVASFKKKWEGRTDCRTEYVVMDCKQYKAPKTPTTPAGATPPTGAGTATAAPQTATAPPATTTTK